ncbi:MAG: hypothetical protein ACR2LX_01430 [Jatrophihabitans sp.]
MRWNDLFADLEAQAAALETAERAGEIDERTRAEIGSLGLLERLRGAVGLPLRLRGAGSLAVTGRLDRVGPDWVLVEEGAGREVLLATAALVSVRGLVRYSATPDSLSVLESRLGLRHALRGIARDRSAVRLHLVDGSTVDATIDRIGADFLEVATHAAGEARRRQDVRDCELLPVTALVAVRRAG